MRRQAGVVWLLAMSGVGASVLQGQTVPAAPAPPAASAPCSTSPQPAPCAGSPLAAKPAGKDRLAFPEETNPAPDAAAPAAPAQKSPAAPAAKSGAGGAFPFPEEDGKPAAGSSSSSSSSGSGDAPVDPDAGSSAPGLKDKGSEGSTQQGRRLLHRVNPIGTKLQTNDEREAEDLDVAHFYTQTGDLQGAYLRTQDAVKLAPDDPDAHFALAEAARKLNKRDEAVAEYAACLKLDPVEKEAKTARKELERLKP